MKPIYQDFVNCFIPHDIEGDRDCHRMRPGSIKNPNEVTRVRSEIEAARAMLVSAGYLVKHIRSLPKKGKAIGERRPIGTQRFVKYGNAEKVKEPYDVVIHARNRIQNYPSGGANYPGAAWAELLSLLRQAGLPKVLAIGAPDAALAPKGSVDGRGIDLGDIMDHMAAARFVLGPSSGPMHLASLCGAPHVVWATDRHQEVIQRRNKDRYTTYWNPLKTHGIVVLHKKKQVLKPAQIMAAVTRLVAS